MYNVLLVNRLMCVRDTQYYWHNIGISRYQFWCIVGYRQKHQDLPIRLMTTTVGSMTFFNVYLFCSMKTMYSYVCCDMNIIIYKYYDLCSWVQGKMCISYYPKHSQYISIWAKSLISCIPYMCARFCTAGSLWRPFVQWTSVVSPWTHRTALWSWRAVSIKLQLLKRSCSLLNVLHKQTTFNTTSPLKAFHHEMY